MRASASWSCNRLERFTALGQLAGGLAHEIKNPLNFISLALDQLRTRYAPQLTQDREDFVRQLSMMKDEVRRLSELVQSFLHYGQPDRNSSGTHRCRQSRRRRARALANRK